MIRPLLATSLVVAASAAAYAAVATAPTILPTEWRLSAPPGTVVPTKTFPESAIPTADGRFLVVVESGAGTPGIRILDALTLATVRDIAIANVYGVPLADRTGSGFWVGTAADDTLVHLDAATGTLTQTIALPRGFWPAGIARSPDGATLAVSGDLADAIVLVDPETGVVRTPIRVSLPERADALVEHDVRNNPASGVVTTGSHPRASHSPPTAARCSSRAGRPRASPSSIPERARSSGRSPSAGIPSSWRPQRTAPGSSSPSPTTTRSARSTSRHARASRT